MSKTRGSKPTVRLLLGLILVAGIALRVWYASFGLKIDRFEDERHSWPNVQSILITGTLVPAKPFYPNPLFNLPPAVSIAVVGKLARGAAGFDTVTGKDGSVAPWALFLCRLWPLLFGCGAIVLTFSIGRILFARSAALLGALFVAFSPFAIHSSGYFKPDAHLLFTTLLAFVLFLKTVERPTRAGYILSGLGVALVLSSKMVGLPILVPLALAIVAAGWYWRGILSAALLAGGSAAVGFVLLNPHWPRYWDWLEEVRGQYADQARRLGSTHVEVPRGALEFLLDGSVQNPLIASLGLVALVALLIGLARRQERHSGWLQRLMFATFPVAYIAMYALVTARFKGNNILPVVPFVLLATGWLLVELWRRAGTRWSWLRTKPAGVAAVLAVLTLSVPPGLVYTYTSLIPTTNHLATQFLTHRLVQPEGRVFYLEPGRVARPSWEGWPRDFAKGRAGLREVENLATVPAASLARADGLAFPASRLATPQGRGLGGYADGRGRRKRMFRARLFQSRGPKMVAIRQHKRRLGPAVPLALTPCDGESSDCLGTTLPDATENAEWFSLILYVAQTTVEGMDGPPAIRIGGEASDPVWVSWQRQTKTQLFVTERMASDPSSRMLTIETAGRALDPANVQVQLCWWSDR